MSTLMKLYGVPLSQPFRSVAWTLLLQKVPFDVKLTVPGATSRMGSLNESFLSKAKGRTGTVPLLEIDESFSISESPAILMYLCEKDGYSLYGAPGTPRKALIDSYMHWHHTGTRSLAALLRPHIRPELNLQVTDADYEKATKILDSLNNGWLQGQDGFIATSDEPTIADLLAFEEVVQVETTGTLGSIALDDYPNVSAWVDRMKQLPHYDQVHESLTVLGNLVEPNETSMPKRLGAATKAGVAALQEAQQPFRQDLQSSKL
jgi:glutathione S-transferase